MMASSQFQFMRALDWRGLAQALAAWIARLAGLDVLPPGCRPIPVGNLDFDPKLAKRLGSINYAVAYAVIYGWIKSNERNGKGRYQRGGRWYTKGSDTAFAKVYAPCMTRPTWARAVDKLAAAGLIVCAEIDDVQAYALGEQASVHGERPPVHGEQSPVNGEHPPVHGEHYKNGDSKNGISIDELKTPAAPARAKAAAAGLNAPNREGIDLANKDGTDELLNAPPGWAPILPPLPAEFAPPPVPPPPSPDDVPTEPDGEAEAESDGIGEETREVLAIFGGATTAEARDYARRWGAAAIKATHAEVTRLPNVRNPAGLTLHRLKHGGGRSVPPKVDYAGGRYADFIEH